MKRKCIGNKNQKLKIRESEDEKNVSEFLVPAPTADRDIRGNSLHAKRIKMSA